MLRRKHDQDQNFWISYADLMAGLLFVFILLVGAIVVKTVMMHSDLEVIRADLQKEKAALGLSEARLAEKKRQLHEVRSKLQASREENLHLSMALSRLQSETDELKAAYATLQTDAEAKTAALALTEKEMAQLKALLLQSETEVTKLQSDAAELKAQHDKDAAALQLRDDELAQLEKALLLKTRAYQQVVEDLNVTRLKVKNLTGIKVRVVQQLKAKLGDSVRIDPKSGALRLASNVLFNQNESTLKPGAKEELSHILGRYIDALLGDSQMRRDIDRITIEGHTNSDGTYLYNLQLSQQRALAVMEFLYQQYPEKRKLFRRYLNASGRSFAEPVLRPDGREDKEASRRIEITFRIRNEQAVQELMNYLNTQERAHGE